MQPSLIQLQKISADYFENVYETHKHSTENIPWAKHQPHPLLIEFLNENIVPKGRAIVVGCGLGDDAVALEAAGFETVAFDFAQSAITLAKERHEESAVVFHVADLFDLPQSWLGTFDFVFEAQTIQSLPLALRDKTITAIVSLLAPKGKVLALAHGKNENEIFQGPPYPLTINELKLFTMKSCQQIEFSILGNNSDDKSSLYFKAVFQKDA